MVAVRVQIVRYVDDTFPGVVEAQLVDARGRRWCFHEKVPIVTSEALLDTSPYPQPGSIACVVLDRAGGTARIGTDRPWGVESVDGETEFEVPVESLIDE